MINTSTPRAPSVPMRPEIATSSLSAEPPEDALTPRARQGVRRMGFLQGIIESSLTCPHGHRLRDGWLIRSEQIVRCNARAMRGAMPCGALVWVLSVPETRGAFLAEISQGDVAALKDAGSTFEILKYLGAPMWPTAQPAADLGRQEPATSQLPRGLGGS